MNVLQYMRILMMMVDNGIDIGTADGVITNIIDELHAPLCDCYEAFSYGFDYCEGLIKSNPLPLNNNLSGYSDLLRAKIAEMKFTEVP